MQSAKNSFAHVRDSLSTVDRPKRKIQKVTKFFCFVLFFVNKFFFLLLWQGSAWTFVFGARGLPATKLIIMPFCLLAIFLTFAGYFASVNWREGRRARASGEVPAPLAPQRRARLHCPTRSTNNNRSAQITSLDRRYNCSRCGKSYKNAYILKRHLLYECGKVIDCWLFIYLFFQVENNNI